MRSILNLQAEASIQLCDYYVHKKMTLYELINYHERLGGADKWDRRTPMGVALTAGSIVRLGRVLQDPVGDNF
jgi:hypothetical protein